MGDGDVVLSVVRYRVKSRTTGRQAGMLLHHYWKFRDGKVVRMRLLHHFLRELKQVSA